MPLIITPKAKQDMIDVATYIADFNPDSARRWRQMLLDACRLLGRMPGLGHFLDGQGDVEHLRVFSKANYLIFYKMQGDDVIVLRVLHAARDWPKLLR